jgi:hypothetical protein
MTHARSIERESRPAVPLNRSEIDYPEYGMRTTPSRFSAFTGNVESPFEAKPTAGLVSDRTAESAIEQRYPAVTRSLTLLWGHPEMNQFFEKISSGEDATLNLDPQALSELMLLAAVHQRVCPYIPAKKVEDFYGAGRWADTWKPARLRG